MDNRDHFEIYNDTDTDCPAGGVCKFSGGVTTDGIVSVIKPDSDSMLNLIVTNFFLPARSVGSGTLDNRVVLTLDPAGGAAIDRDIIGSQAGSFLPMKGNAGFVCVGGSNGLQASANRTSAGAAAWGEAADSSSINLLSPDADFPLFVQGQSVHLPQAGDYEITLCADVSIPTAASDPCSVFARFVTAGTPSGSGTLFPFSPGPGYWPLDASTWDNTVSSIALGCERTHTVVTRVSVAAATYVRVEFSKTGLHDPGDPFPFVRWYRLTFRKLGAPAGGPIGATGPMGPAGTIDGTTVTSLSGFFVGTGGAVAARTLVGGAGIIVVNGSGAGGDPTISVNPSVSATAGSFVYLF